MISAKMNLQNKSKTKQLVIISSAIVMLTLLSLNSMSQTIMAGTGKSNITADCGSVYDSLYVKALVLDNQETSLAIITMDVVAIGTIGDVPDDFFPTINKKLREKLGIKHVLISATHNHLDGFVNGGGKLVDDLEERTLLAVQQALSNIEEVKIGAGEGNENRIAMNRRVRLKDGSVFTIRHSNPNMPDETMEALGVTDSEIGILRIDRLDGTPKAMLFNYACHPYTGVPGKGVTADYPGLACQFIEQQLGHQSMAFFIQGAAGNITEVLYKDVNSPRNSETFGQMLALSTLKAYRNISPVKTSKLKVIQKDIQFPLRTDIPYWIEKLNGEEKQLLESLKYTSLNIKTFIPLYIKYKLSPDYPSYYAYRYMQEEKEGISGLKEMDQMNRQDMDKYMHNIVAMEKLSQIQVNKEMLGFKQKEIALFGGETVDASITGICIGNIVLVSLPAEAFVEVGLDIKASSPFPNTFIAGYTNGYLHYAPSKESYTEGGYEIMNCILSPEWEDIYKEKITEILKKLN